MELNEIVLQFDMDSSGLKIEPLHGGLINTTWMVTASRGKYILQKINENIFDPLQLEHNLRIITDHLSHHHPGYKTIEPILAGDRLIVQKAEGSFRMFEFVPSSHTHNVVESPALAFEAARQFVSFTNNLATLPPGNLQITITRFHDLLFRYGQFNEACSNRNLLRIKEASETITGARQYVSILQTFNELTAKGFLKKRIMHHDTKISNVLFDEQGKGLCVIDLDTVMPGYFISDVGDMIRTYVSPVSEEEKDMTKIEVRADYLAAIREGYFGMDSKSDPRERDYFLFAGKFMTWMQALRFLTDHLNNDVYYGAAYEGHNLVRAVNQLTLLDRLREVTL